MEYKSLFDCRCFIGWHSHFYYLSMHEQLPNVFWYVRAKLLPISFPQLFNFAFCVMGYTGQQGEAVVHTFESQLESCVLKCHAWGLSFSVCAGYSGFLPLNANYCCSQCESGINKSLAQGLTMFSPKADIGSGTPWILSAGEALKNYNNNNIEWMIMRIQLSWQVIHLQTPVGLFYMLFWYWLTNEHF